MTHPKDIEQLVASNTSLAAQLSDANAEIERLRRYEDFYNTLVGALGTTVKIGEELRKYPGPLSDQAIDLWKSQKAEIERLTTAVAGLRAENAELRAALPMQPVRIDEQGTPRFVANSLVRYLLNNNGRIDMNLLATLRGIPDVDRQQFAQLIGYSVSGYGELSYVSDEAYAVAQKAAEAAHAFTKGGG